MTLLQNSQRDNLALDLPLSALLRRQFQGGSVGSMIRIPLPFLCAYESVCFLVSVQFVLNSCR